MSECKHDFDYEGSGEWSCLKCESWFSTEEMNLYTINYQAEQIKQLTESRAAIQAEGIINAIKKKREINVYAGKACIEVDWLTEYAAKLEGEK